MYGPGNVLCTVLVGQDASGVWNAIANEDGWDGTVRVATANMDCARMRVVFPADPSGADPVVVHRNLSTTLRHRRFLFTDSFLLLWKWRVG